MRKAAMPIKVLILGSTLLVSSLAFSHARLKPGSATPPRNDSTGLKSAECGNVARTANPKVFKAGEEITVEWEETINHPGYFIIRFSEAGDKNFDAHVLVAKFADTQNASISGPTAYHQYSTKVKLPNLSCDACTLQLIQVMEENPASPSKYYSCSDIKLMADKAPDPLPVPTEPMPSEPTPPPAGKPLKPSKPGSVKVEKSK
jgi:hypothetical protein